VTDRRPQEPKLYANICRAALGQGSVTVTCAHPAAARSLRAELYLFRRWLGRKKAEEAGFYRLRFCVRGPKVVIEKKVKMMHIVGGRTNGENNDKDNARTSFEVSGST